MKILALLFQIIQAVAYLSAKSIPHHELRPQNIFVDTVKGMVKIAGFGMTGINEDSQTVSYDTVE